MAEGLRLVPLIERAAVAIVLAASAMGLILGLHAITLYGLYAAVLLTALSLALASLGAKSGPARVVGIAASTALAAEALTLLLRTAPHVP